MFRVQKFRVQEKDEETEIAVECSVLDIRFLFDVGRSTFDVHLYNLALMGQQGASCGFTL